MIIFLCWIELKIKLRDSFNLIRLDFCSINYLKPKNVKIHLKFSHLPAIGWSRSGVGYDDDCCVCCHVLWVGSCIVMVVMMLIVVVCCDDGGDYCCCVLCCCCVL